jgi:hypothetical protein
MEEGSAILTLFPQREYAIFIPCFALVLSLVMVGIFVGLVFFREAAKLKNK